MPLRLPLAATLTLLALGVLGGCGTSRAPVPDLSSVQPAGGVRAVAYLHDRLLFNAPAHWAVQTGSAPLVVTLGSGPALIAIWRFRRSLSQPLPADIAAQKRALSGLIDAARARDPTFRVIASAVIVLNGVPGVELDALETISGRVRRVRSTHLYANHSELVVDEYAPQALFHGVDRQIFSPLLHSVRLIG
jgi:hypothetical protein